MQTCIQLLMRIPLATHIRNIHIDPIPADSSYWKEINRDAVVYIRFIEYLGGSHVRLDFRLICQHPIHL